MRNEEGKMLHRLQFLGINDALRDMAKRLSEKWKECWQVELLVLLTRLKVSDKVF